jgi:hypothetical protein
MSRRILKSFLQGSLVTLNFALNLGGGKAALAKTRREYGLLDRTPFPLPGETVAPNHQSGPIFDAAAESF